MRGAKSLQLEYGRTLVIRALSYHVAEAEYRRLGRLRRAADVLLDIGLSAAQRVKVLLGVRAGRPERRSFITVRHGEDEQQRPRRSLRVHWSVGPVGR